MNKLLRTRNRRLLMVYLMLTAGCILPATGIAFNSSRLVLGIPLSILWLLVCFFALVVVSVVAYPRLFVPWGREISSDSDRIEEVRR